MMSSDILAVMTLASGPISALITTEDSIRIHVVLGWARLVVMGGRACTSDVGGGFGSCSPGASALGFSVAALVRLGTCQPKKPPAPAPSSAMTVSYTHLRAHETRHDLVCRLL